MRLMLAAVSVLTFSAPAFAAEEKVDIMNPYVKQQQKVVERALADQEKYTNRWYEHVEERYGIKAEDFKKDETAAPDKDADAKDDQSDDATEVPPQDEKKIRKAHDFFKTYKAYEQSYDADIMDLYSDNADIRITLVHQSGQQEKLTATLAKERLRESMDRAKKRQFVRTFSDVQYAEEGKGIRIKAKATYMRARYNRPFTGPWQILIEPDKDGKWVITEEVIYMPRTPN